MSRRRRRRTNSGVAGSWMGDFGVEWMDEVLVDGGGCGSGSVCMAEAKRWQDVGS